MSDLQVNLGDRFKATKDEDGYPAVKVWNAVWVEEPRWITASALSADQEQNVRDLAAQLVAMADSMARMRASERMAR